MNLALLVERRLSRLESLFAKLLPDVDLNEALVSMSHEVPSPTTSMLKEVNPVSAQGSHLETLTPEPISETVPDEADGFDWQENVDDPADGMAALSVEPKGVGYLGSTAGVFFLRSLLLWLGHPQLLLDYRNPGSASPSFYNQFEASARLSQIMEQSRVLQQLIDSYFAVYHRTYPFVHEATFRAQYHEVIPQPQRRSWQMLLHTILALGAWCSNNARSELEDYIYHRALTLSEDVSMFESANLTYVQALLLLSNLSQKRNKPNTGSNFLGLATRMALSLGLHRELADWDIPLLQREMRRRVWWGLYIFDSGASTTFGRPILLPEKTSMDVRPVLNISDELQSDLHVHSNHISNRLLSATRVTAEDAQSMDRSLEIWSDSVPSYFRLEQQVSCGDPAFLFARYRLWWRFWNIKIILFRQILLKQVVERFKGTPMAFSERDKRSCSVAIQAARSTVASIHAFSQTSPVTKLVAWYSM
ncbi:unnamed protein product [Clonostachys rosea]|uniref:Xylanolytic transcriptional activator regulatory domain-containing protein n=1 Tax=Bionectria ochroleuca TaxID=29856 RepID=A0ABY6UJN7_BIOOC|nr:unnamed protein product [Clonostachys rosea]